MELAWLWPITITYHYLESLGKNTYCPTITKKSQFEMFIWPYVHQLFTKLFLKDATFLHIVAVLNTLPNVKHDETLSEEAYFFIFTCKFKRSLCKTFFHDNMKVLGVPVWEQICNKSAPSNMNSPHCEPVCKFTLILCR